MPERLIKSTIHAGENSEQLSVLIINGGSSSIKFALYETGKPLRRLLNGKVDGIGLSGMNLTVNDPAGKPQTSLNIDSANHQTPVGFLLDWIEAQDAFASVTPGHPWHWNP